MPGFLDTYVAWNTRLRTRWSAVRIRPGALITKKYFDSPGHPAGNKQFEPPTDKQDRFDNPALRRVGRCRARRGGGPERSGGRGAVGPEAIRPGALKNIFLINGLAFRRPQKSTKNRASGK